MDFPELLHDDGPTPETHGPYLSQIVIPTQVTEVIPPAMPLEGSNTGITSNDGNTGITSITTPIGNTQNDEDDGNTQDDGGFIPKTIKIPTSVFRSLDRSWQSRGQPSFHAYCIDVLSRHNELHEISAIIEQYKLSIQNLTDNNIRIQAEYEGYIAQAKAFQDQLNSVITQLTTENNTLRNYIEQASHTPAPTPIAPQTSENDSMYVRLSEDSADLKEQNVRLHSALEQYADLFEKITGIIEQVCKLASAESFRTPDYFMNYFNQLVKPHIPQR